MMSNGNILQNTINCKLFILILIQIQMTRKIQSRVLLSSGIGMQLSKISVIRLSSSCSKARSFNRRLTPLSIIFRKIATKWDPKLKPVTIYQKTNPAYSQRTSGSTTQPCILAKMTTVLPNSWPSSLVSGEVPTFSSQLQQLSRIE